MKWLEANIVGFSTVFLLLTGAALFYLIALGTTSVQVIRIGYGTGGPVRKYFLDQMAVQGKQRNLDIRLVPTAGTDQTLSLIDQNRADLGLIPGAFEDKASRKVFEVAPLYMEPLQLLVKEQLYESVLKDFGQLRGKSIGLDGQNSATSLLAAELLRFIGLADQVTGKPQYQPVYLPQSRLMDLKDASLLPDAIFQIGGVPSPAIRNLIAAGHYRLVPLPFGGAFNLDKFRNDETPDPLENFNLRLNRNFVEESIIPAFTYGVLPAVPSDETRTIATRLMLVGSHRLDDQTVRRILDLIFSPEISNLARPPLSAELLNSSFQFERHPGTGKYLSSLKPFDLDFIFMTYGRIVEVWGIIIALYFAAIKAWKAWRKRRAAEAEGSVSDFLVQILAVEAAADATCSDGDRIVLDQRLSDIKRTVIELHLDDRLKDPENFHTLLVTLADTRTKIWSSAS